MFSIPQSIKPFLKKVSMKLRRLEAACFRQFHGKDVSFVFSRMPMMVTYAYPVIQNKDIAEKLIEKHGKTAPELSKRLEEGVPARILAGNSGHKYGGISK